MTIVVPHHTTKDAAIATIAGAAEKRLTMTGNTRVTIVDKKMEWDGPVLRFSFTGKMGFISVPLAGTITVDDTNATFEAELPGMIKNLVGEDKVRTVVEEKMRELLSAG